MRVKNNQLNQFVKIACERLKGDWVVIGGTVLPLIGVDYRTTMDIDVVGPKSATNEQTLILMEIAEEVGLPAEAINQSAALFLHRVKNWKKSLEIIQEGKGATIYRPNVNLFINLKLNRFTETDLSDCVKYLEWARKNGEEIQVEHLIRLIKKIIKGNPHASKEERLRRLQKVLKDS